MLTRRELGTKLHSGLHDEAPLKVAVYLPPAADPSERTSCRVPYWCEFVRVRPLHSRPRPPQTPAASFKSRYRKSSAIQMGFHLYMARLGFPMNANDYTTS